MEEKIGINIKIIMSKNNQVLFLKNKNGDWFLPGGNMNFGEEFEQTARRIVKKILGTNLKKVKIICANNDLDSNLHNVAIGTLSDEWENDPELKEREEYTDISWFALEDSPFPVEISSAKILLNLRKGKFYFSN